MEKDQIIDGVKRYVQQQKNVAKEIGVHPVTFSQILGGIVEPGGATLFKMQNWLLKQENGNHSEAQKV